MSAFLLACLCICFAQNALGQAIGFPNSFGPCAGGFGMVPGNLATGSCPGNIVAGTTLGGLTMAGVPISGVSPIGYGDVAITGELPVGGNTAIAGNVPVIGYVMFEGHVPAGGTVSVASNCDCYRPVAF